MRCLSTRTRAVIDYLAGVLLIAAPYLLGFADEGAAQWIPIILGASALVYSLLTRYELGVLKLIPMPLHLLLDAGSGLLLAASPWLFGFAGLVYLPHLVIGIFEIAASLMTRTTPDLQDQRLQERRT